MGLQPLVRDVAGARGTGLQPLVRVGAGSTSAGARLYLGSVLLPRQPEQLQAERRLALLPPLELERRQRLRVRSPLRRLALLARFGCGRGRADGDGAQSGWGAAEHLWLPTLGREELGAEQAELLHHGDEGGRGDAVAWLGLGLGLGLERGQGRGRGRGRGRGQGRGRGRGRGRRGRVSPPSSGCPPRRAAAACAPG